ncbi:divergent polysaccharide deacetylase family protein [Eionea flava]
MSLAALIIDRPTQSWATLHFLHYCIIQIAILYGLAFTSSAYADINIYSIDETYNIVTPSTLAAPLRQTIPIPLIDNIVKPLEAPIKDIQSKPYDGIDVAIIIDDIGYNYTQGLQAIQLPGDITYAIIPHSPKADFFAEKAMQLHKEIMLHAPMSTINHAPIGKHGLSELLGEERFKSTLQTALSSLPNAKGLNNHMGSLLTQKDQPMTWVMEALKERQLYFVDSRTTAKSIAWNIAQKHGIPALKRDVFLDHEPNTAFIHKQFQSLIRIAKQQGYAVAIAHPYPETIAYLQTNLSTLSLHNINLVTASTLAKRVSLSKMSPKIAKSVTPITQKVTQ